MSMSQPYTRRFTRRSPGLFIVLLDQSYSMSETLLGEEYESVSKADLATQALNNIISSMIDAAGTDLALGRTKKLAYLSVWGYNDSVHPLLPQSGGFVDISYLSENAKGMKSVDIERYNRRTQTYEVVSVSRPFWIEAAAVGTTRMEHAFAQARDVARKWIISPSDAGQDPRDSCFPPVIINITDAQYNNDSDPIATAHEIMREGTQQGNILIFNCHFTRNPQQSIIFPGSTGELASVDPYARQMFEMSSPIPDALRAKAIEVTNGIPIAEGARALVYDADPDMLVNFLKWGTIGTGGLGGELEWGNE